jgi:hypothetical protein
MAVSTKSTSYKEQTVVLMSNVRSGDKLNDFANPIPSGFLQDYDSHTAAIMSVGLHSKFKNNATPVHTEMPPFIQMTVHRFITASSIVAPISVKKPLKLEIFDPFECYYIDQHASYTTKELHEHLEQTAFHNRRKLETEYMGYVHTYMFTYKKQCLIFFLFYCTAPRRYMMKKLMNCDFHNTSWPST